MKQKIIIVHKCADSGKPNAKKGGWIAYIHGKTPPVQAFAKTEAEAVRMLAEKLYDK